MADGTCIIDGCDKPRYQRRRLCSTHAMRKHRYGDPLADRARVGRTWLTDNGYEKQGLEPGHQLRDGRGAASTHRLVLYRVVGPGPQSCHWCGATVDWLPFRGTWSGVLVVDHLDGNKRNNAPANLVPACFSCNVLRARWGDDSVRKRNAARGQSVS